MSTSWGQTQAVPGVQTPSIRPLSATLAGAGVVLIAGDVVLCGWSVRETTGLAGAVVQLFNGTSTGSQLVAEDAVGPGATDVQPGTAEGIWLDTGLFVNVPQGTASVVCWVRDI